MSDKNTLNKVSITDPEDIARETERLRTFREVRRRASDGITGNQANQADLDRAKRMELFEEDKTLRIKAAEDRRRADAVAIEDRRMDKARAHLEALDDIETAMANLLRSRHKTRKIAALLLGVFVGLPTLVTALFFGIFATAVFQSESIFALDSTQPVAMRSPLFSDNSADASSSMSPAFQLRARLYSPDFQMGHATTTDPATRPFEIKIDSYQGLITLRTTGPTAQSAQTLNYQIISDASYLIDGGIGLTVLSQPNLPVKNIPKALANTLLVFLSSLTIFAISAIFFQSFIHYAKN